MHGPLLPLSRPGSVNACSVDLQGGLHVKLSSSTDSIKQSLKKKYDKGPYFQH